MKIKIIIKKIVIINIQNSDIQWNSVNIIGFFDDKYQKVIKFNLDGI